MSTGPAPRKRRKSQFKTSHRPNAHPNVFSVPAQKAGASKAYDATAELEEKIEKLQKDFNTERYIYIFGIVSLIDILSFKILNDSVVALIIIVLLELIPMCVLGSYLNVETAVVMCEGLMTILSKMKP